MKIETESDTTPAQQLTKKELVTRFAKLAGPFTMVRFIGTASDMANAIFLAAIDKNHLAANGLISTTRDLSVTSSLFSQYTTGALVGEAISKKETSEVGGILTASYIYAIAIGLANSAMLYFAGPLVRAIGQDAQVADITDQYFKALVYSGGPFATFFSVSGQQTAYGIGKSHVSLGINIIRRAIHVGLAYWMIYGGAGVPALGAAGSAYANSISSWVDAIFFALYYKFNKNLAEYGFFQQSPKASLTYLTRMVKKGVILGVQTINEFLSSFAAVNLSGRINVDSLAAASITNQYLGLANIPISAAAQSATIAVSRLRKSNLEDARHMGRVSILCGFIVPAVVIPLYSIAGRTLTNLFVNANTPDASAVQDIAQTLMIVSSVTQLPNMIRQLCGGVLRGHDEYLASMITGIIGLSFVGIPAGLALGYLTNLSATGIYLGGLIGTSLGASAASFFYARKERALIQEVSKEKPIPAIETQDCETRVLIEQVDEAMQQSSVYGSVQYSPPEIPMQHQEKSAWSLPCTLL
ncbi:MAG: mdtK [Gammaproteobacteria bacterium]|nr:mdtK [Gammaproteobacteria bacterium]